MPESILTLHASFYSDMQDPAKARLILIRGEGMDGLSYHLKADQHLVGRAGQVEFPRRSFRLAEAREFLLSRRSPGRP